MSPSESKSSSPPSEAAPQAVMAGSPAGRRLKTVIGLLVLTFFAEFIGGNISGSLSLVSDSFHVLGDTFALGLAFGALTIANRRLPTEKMTYGYGRLEVLSALLNGVTLVAASVVIFYQATQRFFSPPDVQVSLALPIAMVGLGVNGFAAYVLRSGRVHLHDLNIRGAYLHVLADFGASVAVIAGLIAIRITGAAIIDPIVAAGISVVLIVGAARVLRQGAGILLQQSPHDVAQLRDLIRTVDHVVEIDDFRLWQICSHMVIGTAHVITDVESLEETEEISNQIRSLLEERYQVKHLTLQFETQKMWEQHTHEVRHEEKADAPGDQG
ncbi:MAG: cation diffusion facilitator family transporter [Planctomycetota bacterium]|nr:cation diffusion facilitator family transporter [Planctomycetota bacterium]